MRVLGVSVVFMAAELVLSQTANATPPVTVIVSSNAGDRLTIKASLTWESTYDTSAPIVTIHPSTTYQTIAGFGASFLEAGMICLNSLDSVSRGAVLSTIFDSVSGSAFSAMKTAIAATDFASADPWYSYDDVAGDVNLTNFSIARDLGPNGMMTYIKLARKYGGKFVLEAPMDYPPDWMLYNVNNNQDVNPAFFPALANYYLKYVQAYEANGVFIDYISTFNEPGIYTKIGFDSIATIIRDHVGPAFAAAGVRTKIMACEVNTRTLLNTIGSTIMNNSGASPFVSIVGYHGYETFPDYTTVSNFVSAYPNTPVWMTELCYAQPLFWPYNWSAPVYNFSDGENWGRIMYNDLNAGASAWIYWNMILDQNGGPWLVSPVHGNPDPNGQHPLVYINRSTGAITYTGVFYYLSHFSKFVRPGFIRINVNPDTTGNMYIIAFKSTDSSKRVINLMNTNTSNTAINIRYNNQYVTDTLPANSITTFIAQDSIAADAHPGAMELNSGKGKIRVTNQTITLPDRGNFELRLYHLDGRLIKKEPLCGPGLYQIRDFHVGGMIIVDIAGCGECFRRAMPFCEP